MTKEDIRNREYIIKPVGIVSSDLKNPHRVSEKETVERDGDEAVSKEDEQNIKSLISKINLNPDLKGILEGLQRVSHVLVIYWPHLSKPGSREIIRVHPMGNRKLKQVGVFASCSPARPNPILITAVKLLEVGENHITVQGLEAVDGSPVLDIKPYSRHYLEVENLETAEWERE